MKNAIAEDLVVHRPAEISRDRVEIVDKGGRYPDCDALITQEANLFLAVTIADCVPILLYDPVTKVIAAVHAGWRGSTNGILAKTLGMLNEQFHVRPQNLHAYVGQSAGVCCYEVGEEVAAHFDADFLYRPANKRQRLDLKKFTNSVLLRHGIPERQIGTSAHCTICEANLFHSYRREMEKSGRMMAVIGRKSV